MRMVKAAIGSNTLFHYTLRLMCFIIAKFIAVFVLTSKFFHEFSQHLYLHLLIR